MHSPNCHRVRAPKRRERYLMAVLYVLRQRLETAGCAPTNPANRSNDASVCSSAYNSIKKPTPAPF